MVLVALEEHPAPQGDSVAFDLNVVREFIGNVVPLGPAIPVAAAMLAATRLGRSAA